MVVLRSWLEEFINIAPHSNDQIVNALNSVGFEVESIFKYTPPQNIVIGHIVKCEQHPDAEKLSVCEVDVGDHGHIQIVCGASNVREGLSVAVAIDGALMPNGLKIAKTTLRGIDSHGMICSAEELGYIKINNGIWELDSSLGKLIAGQELSHLPSLNETIITIDVTPNRGDCLSVIGIARELAAYFNLKLKKPIPSHSDEHEPGIGRALNVHYSPKSKSISAISVAKNHLQDFKNSALINFRLALCELASNNEYEKACLYVTHATGVLINVYPSRLLMQKDDRMELFISPNDNGLDIIKSEKELATISVEQKEFANADDNSIILHAFYTTPSSMRDIKIPQTKTIYLAKRGSEPELLIGLNYLSNLLRTVHGATFYSGVLEFGQLDEPVSIKMDVGLVEDIIGQELDKNMVVNLLTRLFFKVSTNIEFDNCLVVPPIFRHDISNVYDLSEEVLRLKGLDAIKAKPLAISNPKIDTDALNELAFKKKLRYKSAAMGFYETIHFIFTQKSLLEKLGFATLDFELEISNPITAELDTLRTSLLPNMLQSAKLNANNSKKCIAFFELGVVFDKNRNENFKLSYLYSGETQKDDITNSGKPKIINLSFFISRIACVIGEFELINKESTSSFWHPYVFADIMINGQKIGILGKIHPKICDEFGLSDSFACEIDLQKLTPSKQKAKEFSKFQVVIRDLTISWPKNLAFSMAKNVVTLLNCNEIKNFYAIDWFDTDKKSKNANLTVRVLLQSNDKTLSEEDIVLLMKNITKVLEDASREYK